MASLHNHTAGTQASWRRHQGTLGAFCRTVSARRCERRLRSSCFSTQAVPSPRADCVLWLARCAVSAGDQGSSMRGMHIVRVTVECTAWDEKVRAKQVQQYPQGEVRSVLQHCYQDDNCDPWAGEGPLLVPWTALRLVKATKPRRVVSRRRERHYSPLIFPINVREHGGLWAHL